MVADGVMNGLEKVNVGEAVFDALMTQFDRHANMAGTPDQMGDR